MGFEAISMPLIKNPPNLFGQLKDHVRRKFATDMDPISKSALPRLKKENFLKRHVGTNELEIMRMLREIGFEDKNSFLEAVNPEQTPKIRFDEMPEPISELELKQLFQKIGSMNKLYRSYLGRGFYGTHTPLVIQKDILENPMWYTPYSPYQAEISQGRLESLFNFQTMISEITGLRLANASLLDEASSAAEAMTMLFNYHKKQKSSFLVSKNCFENTISCLKIRAKGLGIKLVLADEIDLVDHVKDAFGLLLQYPDRCGRVSLNRKLIEDMKIHKIPVVLATDLMALTLIKEPGPNGHDADVAIGSAQRFGVPMGFGGPHAAFFACDEQYKRFIPGRIVGKSKDSRGNEAYRLALQTREQHIRREKATSNICTAQALLANLSSMYGIYHGPRGLKEIALRIHQAALILADASRRLGFYVVHSNFFDTIVLESHSSKIAEVLENADANKLNFGQDGANRIQISVDEITTNGDIETICKVLSGEKCNESHTCYTEELIVSRDPNYFKIGIPNEDLRTSSFMEQDIFNRHQSETELTRYIYQLSAKDVTLVNSMMPLGSCTMKLNSSSELYALRMAEFSDIHPDVPVHQVYGYEVVFEELKQMLGNLTGLRFVSLQPNSGAQGEYLALSIMRKVLDPKKNICLVPTSAHGTNASSAYISGFKVISVKADINGSIDTEWLERYLRTNGQSVGVIMLTYPSTFGLFDKATLKAIEMVKSCNGLVYIDGANMNAIAGYTRISELGADACHLNLHKTFCIPHGGGGPGVGPICLNEQLGNELPLFENIASAKYGSASILTISWAYLRLLGLDGIKESSFRALLHANYMMKRLRPFYEIKFISERNLCAHEFIIDLNEIEENTGITVLDVAKRLQDYGFHAPTMAWPISKGLMIEPTESESLREIDRFLESMISIREEIAQMENGILPRDLNLLKLAPHTLEDVCASEWCRPYSREQAVFPLPYLRSNKIWPSVNRVDDAYGDKNFTCTIC